MNTFLIIWLVAITIAVICLWVYVYRFESTFHELKQERLNVQNQWLTNIYNWAKYEDEKFESIAKDIESLKKEKKTKSNKQLIKE